MNQNMDQRFCKFPRWKPELWNENIPKKVKDHTNCYSYALGRLELNIDDKLQPGELSGKKYDKMDCDVIFEHIKKDLNRDDVYKTSKDSKINCLQRKIALVIDEKSEDKDYHFYRLDSNNTWSHKPGSTSATNKDASDNIIYDPKKADRDYSNRTYKDKDGKTKKGKNYEIFCGYYIIPVNGAPVMYDWDNDNKHYKLDNITNIDKFINNLKIDVN